jgi:2-hydroxychromene-2-carboxylate isomerase
MDCRREANLRGLTIRGTQKIWDSSLANIGLLFARRENVVKPYHDRVFERFWRRDLDIENVDVLSALLTECGADGPSFPAVASDAGRRELLDVQREAEAAGVFGVPSVLFDDGDLYWGREHLPRIRQLLLERREAIGTR